MDLFPCPCHQMGTLLNAASRWCAAFLMTTFLFYDYFNLSLCQVDHSEHSFKNGSWIYLFQTGIGNAQFVFNKIQSKAHKQSTEYDQTFKRMFKRIHLLYKQYLESNYKTIHKLKTGGRQETFQ